MLNLSPRKLKAISRIRGIKNYKSMSEDRLLSDLKTSESLKESEKNFDKPRLKKIRNKLMNQEINFLN